ncbi:hypothetical protein J2T12_004105 [Paenibacillus anaericanus]|uniref:hypothetical protein n=1 Tax=Paenibacillus anaericanus TaxID=170367 RepID=UPI00277FBDAE|nr:hypothetical protein [Paenibacillus anaericanus]MDQ0090682.1 hypothetical protein [Paenibacillus anaericanus]
MMDVQVWIEFLKENWLVIVVALVVLFLILNFVKTVVKWALVLVIAAFIIIYSGLSLKDLSSAVSVVTEQATSIGKDQVLNVMKNEAKDAKLTKNSDGTFTITTSNLEVTGTIGGDKVKVVSHGISLGEWKVNDTVEAFIQEATRNSK